MTFSHGIDDKTDIYNDVDMRWLTSSTSAAAADAMNATSDNVNHPTTNKMNLELLSTVLTNLLLFFLIFGLSATVNMKDYKKQFTKNTTTVLVGNALQFLLMPFLGFVSITAFHHWGYNKIMGIMLLVMTASPGGSYSNWWCSIVNADLSLSVAITSLSSVLSIFMLPANILFYHWLIYQVIFINDSNDDDNFSLNFGDIYIPLAVDIFGIVCGLLVGYTFDNPTFHRYANYLGSICGFLLILVGAILTSANPNSPDTDSTTSLLTWPLVVATGLPCLLGICVTNFIAIRFLNISKPETVALAIETCYQNNAIALSVAVTMFGNDPSSRAIAIVVPFFYGLVEMIVISVYGIFAWKMGWTRAPAEASICTVITTTYEVDDDDDDDGGDRTSSDNRDEEKFDENKNQNSNNGKDKDIIHVIDTDDGNSLSTIDMEAPSPLSLGSNSSDDISVTNFVTLNDNVLDLPLGTSDRRKSFMSLSRTTIPRRSSSYQKKI